jgi:catecholate siderophore receptor
LKIRNETRFSHYATDARATNAASVLTGPLATSKALSNGNYTALSISQSLFNIEKTNARTRDATGAYTLDGDVRVRGYQIDASGRFTGKWQLYGGYTYLNGRIMKASDGTQGKTPANTPRNMLTLWTTYEFSPHWEVGGGANYVSARYAANSNAVSVGGYTRWDATLAYHAKQYDIRQNVLNLTDKRYYDALIPSDGGRAVPGIGRTFLATFNYRI